MKTQLNQSIAQAVEADGSVTYPELMVAIATGDGANPITGVSSKAFPADVTDPTGTGTQDALISPKGGLISVVRISGGIPVADIVDTAEITDDGVLDPGVDVGSDALLIFWQVAAGDPCVSKVGK